MTAVALTSARPVDTALSGVIQANTSRPLQADGLARLLTVLCEYSGQDAALKDLLGAMPTDPDMPMGEAVLATVANLGFEAHRVSRPGEAVGPWLLTGPRTEAPEVVIQDYSGDLWRHKVDGSIRRYAGKPLPKSWTCWAFRSERLLHFTTVEQRQHTGYGWMRALGAQLVGMPRLLALTSLLIVVTAVTLPLLVSTFYAQVFALADFTPVPYFALASLAVVLLKGQLFALRTRALSWAANRLDYLVSTATFARLMALPPQILERANARNQAARLKSFEGVRDFLSGPIAIMLLDLPIALAVIIALAIVSPAIAAALAFVAAGHGVLFWYVWRRVRVQTSVMADRATETQRMMIETFEKRSLIRECGLQERWADLQTRTIAADQGAQMRLRLLGAASEAAAGILLSAGLMFIFVVSVYEIWAGRLPAAYLLGLLLATMISLAPFHGLCLAVPRIEQVRKSIAQIDAFMQTATEADVEVDRRLPEMKGNLAFLNATFRTSDTRPVFVGLDLSVRTGEIIGIAGGNSSGKTTILKFAQGMIVPQMGALHVEGVDVRQLSPQELRRRIAYIPQEPVLLPGSLRNNLAFANPLVSEERLHKALELTGIGWAADLLDAPVPPEAAQGTEFRFRFALAQALLLDSQLWLIDEMPNALLNGGLGHDLKRILKAAKGRRTVLFVSNRSDFLSLADRVVALRYGQVPRINTPAQLFESVT
ncbi:ATP-binding cassette domain-containing protein [Pseudomonas sp. ODNR1LW]|nr:ATP-binding cassette domain-containing protein [Pseudomonas sp. ODNR1LW]